jgi:ketosteroid isomerase-like protein
MTDIEARQVKDRLWQIVQDVNRVCREGQGFDRLAAFFHEGMVMVLPGVDYRAEGRAACLRCYQDACSTMKIHRLDGSQERIDLWDGTAVAAYRYDCVWEWQGKTFTDEGREILVLVRDGQDWRIAWRTLIPGSRKIQGGDAEEVLPRDREVRQVCMDLMRTRI